MGFHVDIWDQAPNIVIWCLQNNLDKTRLGALREIMQVCNNQSPLPGDVLW
jgi:hypothetical protein